MSLRFLEDDAAAAMLFVCQFNEHRSRDVGTGAVVQSMVAHKSCAVWWTNIESYSTSVVKANFQ